MSADQPTPDVETVLAEHRPWRNQVGIVKHCRCGEVMDGVKRHDAHLAAALEPLIREREAKALEDAADEWDDPSPENVARLRQMALDQYRAGGPSMPAVWLRDRAATHRTRP